MNKLFDLNPIPEETIEEYKVRCFKCLIDEVFNIFSNIRKHKIKVIYSNSDITESDLSDCEGLVCISNNGVFYWFRPYSEPGAPRLGSYKLNDIDDFINIHIKNLVVTESAPYSLSKENNLEGGYKDIADQVLELQAKEKSLLLKDMKAVLERSENYFELYIALMEEDINLIKQYLEDGTVNKAEIKNKEIEEYIALISNDEREEIKSLRSGFIFKLLWSASKLARENYKFDWNSDEYKESSDNLNYYIKKITPVAKEYFANRLVEFSRTEYVKKINSIIFNY